MCLRVFHFRRYIHFLTHLTHKKKMLFLFQHFLKGNLYLLLLMCCLIGLPLLLLMCCLIGLPLLLLMCLRVFHFRRYLHFLTRLTHKKKMLFLFQHFLKGNLYLLHLMCYLIVLYLLLLMCYLMLKRLLHLMFHLHLNFDLFLLLLLQLMLPSLLMLIVWYL